MLRCLCVQPYLILISKRKLYNTGFVIWLVIYVGESDIKIKDLVETELDAFWKIQSKHLDAIPFDEIKKGYYDNSDLYICCYDTSEIRGIAYGSARGNLVILEGVAVVDKMLRKGLGSRLLICFEDKARRKGFGIVSVGSAEGYVEKFYIKNGYVPVEMHVKDEDHNIILKESVDSYEEGLRRREELRKKHTPKEIIFIMNKML